MSVFSVSDELGELVLAGLDEAALGPEREENEEEVDERDWAVVCGELLDGVKKRGAVAGLMSVEWFASKSGKAL